MRYFGIFKMTHPSMYQREFTGSIGNGTSLSNYRMFQVAGTDKWYTHRFKMLTVKRVL